MTSKERMQIAMEHEEPDRVSYMSTFVPEVELFLQEKYKKELAEIGSKTELKYQGMNELDILFGHDMLLLTYGISTGYYRDTDSDTYIDEWGIKWKKIPYETAKGAGYYTEIIEFPLADEARLWLADVVGGEHPVHPPIQRAGGRGG